MIARVAALFVVATLATSCATPYVPTLAVASRTNCQVMLPGWDWLPTRPRDADALLAQIDGPLQPRAFEWFVAKNGERAVCAYAVYGGCEDRVDFFRKDGDAWRWREDKTMETLCLLH